MPSPLSALSPLNFDLIAFDWDGTLFDSTKIIVRCIQAAVRDVGGTVPTDEAAGYVIGLGLMQALAHAAPDVPQDKYPELGARYRHHYTMHQNDLSLFDGVLPLLVALKARGHSLAVATGKSRQGLDEALHAVELLLVSDVDGVLVDGVAMSQLDAEAARAAISSGVARGGMAAKLEAALGALARGVARVRIGAVGAVSDEACGTVITLAGVLS